MERIRFDTLVLLFWNTLFCGKIRNNIRVSDLHNEITSPKGTKISPRDKEIRFLCEVHRNLENEIARFKKELDEI